ncbi:uncharacterized LabA/DUF88 family protein [Natronospira proteinivora]|uniref:Uncharacterized LabA/DUF88 family protein n=1 Tax=Natronospira proteinivora TaxID=1807133 RepID=A0ABT1GAM8_9GAMM|nr:NYN domain-containing protein [Natronospira proteinivora]MCP1728326.1 uncharacterized LabA/DUF88 family protein [Natronospira proteinivora]
MKTAILIDGAYFVKRYRALYPEKHDEPIEDTVSNLYAGAINLLRKANRPPRSRELYRIFFYDCPPLAKYIHNPVSQRGERLAESREAIFRHSLHEQLKRQRKVALRLGRLDENNARWELKGDLLKKLLRGTLEVKDIQPTDVFYHARQKGVDMKIASDIASLAHGGHVDQIILVAGDSDFVPAAKLARRNGIDFVLDPMWNHINPDLFEHIDGLCGGWKNPRNST